MTKVDLYLNTKVRLFLVGTATLVQDPPSIVSLLVAVVGVVAPLPLTVNSGESGVLVGTATPVLETNRQPVVS